MGNKFRLTRHYLTFIAYSSYCISFSQQTQSWNICMPNIRYPKQKKEKNPCHPYLTFFTHRVTGNPKRTIVFLDLVCMYLLPNVCMQNICIYLLCEKKMDSLLRDINNPKAPSPFTNKIVGV